MAPMRPSTRESEIKLRFPSAADARESLRCLDARPVRERALEDNVLYDLPGSPLESSGCLLRLRRYGEDALLTFKAPVPEDSPYKLRTEHQTRVEDPESLHRILVALGYRPVYRYQKFRTVFRLGDLEIALDETPIGCWVELEGPPPSIDSTARSMGFGPERYVRETYLDLHRVHAAERGEPVGDLLFGDGAERRDP